jgi:hypothetical protein
MLYASDFKAKRHSEMPSARKFYGVQGNFSPNLDLKSAEK